MRRCREVCSAWVEVVLGVLGCRALADAGRCCRVVSVSGVTLPSHKDVC